MLLGLVFGITIASGLLGFVLLIAVAGAIMLALSVRVIRNYD